MQIKHQGQDKFELKSKELSIILGPEVSINDFVFPGPGEYEKGGAILNGIADGDNTIYVLRVEEMNICYLGHIKHDLSEDETKQIGDVDILFLPLGEEGTIDLKTALKLLSKIDPKIVIPMLYTDLAEFKKSEGITDNELDVLKIRKIDLPEEERQVFILKASL
jgi:L-ascorbate metabolism protein UlaG (beta-lactamase superfamily)